MHNADSIGCTGLTSVNNDESALHRVEFSWGQSSTAVLAIKINCLSTEFAAKKHGEMTLQYPEPTLTFIISPPTGGEKGVPLKLFLEISQVDGEPLGEGGQLLYQGGCGIKVFKDKGGDRKQRQDQSKIEKLSPDEQVYSS